MQLRVVGLIELDTSVSNAARIQKQLDDILRTFRGEDGVLSISVDTLARRGKICEDVNQITFRTKKYDARTGKPKND